MTNTQIEFRERLKAALRAEPKHYDQGEFVPDSTCGTACCVAGHAFMLSNNMNAEEFQYWYWKCESHGALSIMTKAKEAMGLTKDQADVLFVQSNFWPRQFQFAFRDSDAQKVEKVCAFIDYLTAGGEVESLARRVHSS